MTYDKYGNVPFEDFALDTPENRDRCVNCERAECNNCLGAYTLRKKDKPKATDGREDEIMRLLEKGYSDQKVAELTGIYYLAIYEWRRKNGIQSSRQRKKPNADEIKRLYKNGWSYCAIGRKLGISATTVRRYCLGVR